MRLVGLVEISGNDTAAKCIKCGKSLAYQLPMSIGVWNLILKAFVDKHKECKE
jgi:hypothetical protein